MDDALEYEDRMGPPKQSKNSRHPANGQDLILDNLSALSGLIRCGVGDDESVFIVLLQLLLCACVQHRH